MESENLKTTNQLENYFYKIQEKVVPYKVMAKVKTPNSEFIGEIIEDRQNGERYSISYLDETKWYDKYYIEVLYNDEEEVQDLSNEEINFYVNYKNFISPTDYFIWVDVYRNQTYVLKKNKQVYELVERFKCSTGENHTPTKRGMFQIVSKGKSFIGRDKTYLCYNYLQYDGSYLLHSFPYDFDQQVLDDRLSQRVSNGCVRFNYEDSFYLYKNIPLSTSIWIN